MTAPEQLQQLKNWQRLTQWWHRRKPQEESDRLNPEHSPHNLTVRLIIGGTTLIVSLSAYYSYHLVRNLLLENLKNKAFLEVQQGAEEIDNWIGKYKAALESSANNPTFRTMLKTW